MGVWTARLYRAPMMRPLGKAVALSAVLLTLALGCDAGNEGGKPTSDGRAPQGPRSETTARSAGDPQGPGQQTIPGMNAEAAASTLQKPGLECWQPVDAGVLYACSGDEDTDLLVEAEITGSGIDRVSGVEARVSWQGSGDFEMASQPFLGFLSTQLQYQGSDKNRAYEFVNGNLSSERASTTIGAVKWTITTSDDSKVLAIAPA